MTVPISALQHNTTLFFSAQDETRRDDCLLFFPVLCHTHHHENSQKDGPIEDKDKERKLEAVKGKEGRIDLDLQQEEVAKVDLDRDTKNLSKVVRPDIVNGRHVGLRVNHLDLGIAGLAALRGGERLFDHCLVL